MYHFQTKWRDEPRSRGGLIRVREFTMKDAYSADRDEAGLDHSYSLYYHAYTRIFARLGLKTIAVASDVGMMGGSQAHEFMAFSEYGEDTLVICDTCKTASNRQVARVRRATPASEAPLPLEEVKTPDAPTIEALAKQLGAPWTITISPRSLDAGGAELTRRADGERSVVPLAEVLERITAAKRAERERIEADLASSGFPATYQGGPAAG